MVSAERRNSQWGWLNQQFSKVKAKRLRVPPPSPLAQISDLDSDDSGVEELRAFVEECAKLIFDPDLGDGQ
jgi:hypothetical protein